MVSIANTVYFYKIAKDWHIYLFLHYAVSKGHIAASINKTSSAQQTMQSCMNIVNNIQDTSSIKTPEKIIRIKQLLMCLLYYTNIKWWPLKLY